MADNPTPDEIKKFFDKHPGLRGKILPPEILADQKAWETWRQNNAPRLSPEDIRFFTAQQFQKKTPTPETSDPDEHDTSHRGHAEHPTGRLAATTKGLEDDKRYKNIIKNTVEDWNTKHANEAELQIRGRVFIKDTYGHTIINPAVLAKIPDIHERAKDTLALGHGQEVVDYYDHVEAVHIYKDPRSDPLFRRLHQTIDQRLEGTGKTGHEAEVARQNIVQEEYAKFVREHPEKAAHYRHADPQMDRFYKAYRREFRKTHGRIVRTRRWVDYQLEKRRVLTNPSDDTTIKELEAGVQTKVAKGMDRQKVSEAALDEYVQRFKKKSLAYASQRPDIQAALVREKERKKISRRLGRRFHGARTGISDWREEKRTTRWGWNTRVGNLKDGWKNTENWWRNPKDSWENIKSFFHRDPKKDKRLAFLALFDPNNEKDKKKLETFVEKNPRTAKRYANKDPYIKAVLEKKKKIQQARKLSERRGVAYQATRRLRRDTSLVALGLTFDEGTIERARAKAQEPQSQIPVSQPLAKARPIELQKFERGRFELRGKFRDWQQEKAKQLTTAFRSFFKTVRSPGLRQTTSIATGALDRGIKNLGSQALSRGSRSLGRLASRPSIPINGLPGISPRGLTRALGSQAQALFMRYLVLYGGILLIVLFITLVILTWLVLILTGNKTKETTVPEAPQAQNIVKTGPESIPDNNGTITYTITVNSGASQAISVIDRIFGSATYVSADPEPSDISENTDGSLQSVTWSVSGSKSASQSIGTTNAVLAFNQDAFSAEGFPPPSSPPAQLDEEALRLWKSYFVTHAIKAADEFGIDVGYVGFWSFFEGINYKLTFNNCNNAPDRFNPNSACSSRNVQVGPGIRPYDLPASALQDAFDTMYGGHDNATVKRVGQQVIQNMQERHNVKITYPASSFPDISLQDIMSANTPEEKHWFEHLVKDDAISMYYLARTFKGHLDAGKLADVMEGWGGSYPRQTIINYIKAVYDAGLSGEAPPPDGQPPSDTPSGGEEMLIKLTVKPRSNNTYIYNIAEIGQ